MTQAVAITVDFNKQDVRVVGNDPVMFTNYIDKDQLWLSFVQAIFVVTKKDSSPKAGEVSPYPRRRLDDERFAFVTSTFRTLYHHVKDVHQLPLPFPDRRSISAKEAKLIKEADYPGFERTKSGNIATVHYPRDFADEFREWCAENCLSRYSIHGEVAEFMLVRDAAIAKLFAP